MFLVVEPETYVGMIVTGDNAAVVNPIFGDRVN